MPIQSSFIHNHEKQMTTISHGSTNHVTFVQRTNTQQLEWNSDSHSDTGETSMCFNVWKKPDPKVYRWFCWCRVGNTSGVSSSIGDGERYWKGTFRVMNNSCHGCGGPMSAQFSKPKTAYYQEWLWMHIKIKSTSRVGQFWYGMHIVINKSKHVINICINSLKKVGKKGTDLNNQCFDWIL
jgi:hypothetical protein